MSYLARKNMRCRKHTFSIRDYVKEFSSLMLEIPNMTEKEFLFNFMDNLQGWVEQELRRWGIQDLATDMEITVFNGLQEGRLLQGWVFKG